MPKTFSNSDQQFNQFNFQLNQMFVCSDSGVYLYNLQSRDKEIRIILDVVSAPARCCSLQQGFNEGHFMVGRDDVSVYFILFFVRDADLFSFRLFTAILRTVEVPAMLWKVKNLYFSGSGHIC